MKITKFHIIALSLAIIATIAVMLVLFYDPDQIKAEFATYEELQQSGYFEKGWLPPFLPKSSTNIIETHNLDTNIVKALFNFTSSDTAAVETACIHKTVIENGTEYQCEFEGRHILIKLLNSGEGFLHSSPVERNTDRHSQ